MEPFGAALPRLKSSDASSGNGTSPVPGPLGAAWVARLAETECPGLTARRARRAESSGAQQDPIVWVRAQGINVEDADGNVFVDLTSGFGAAFVGHGHPAVVSAIESQAKTLFHALGDLHPSDVKIALLERLARLAPWENARVMLGTNGSDAVEAALKTGMLASGKAGVLAFEGSYHGLSFGALSVSGYSDRFRAPFRGALMDGVVFARFPTRDDSVAGAMADIERRWTPDLGTILVEPIQGRAGVRIPPDGFLAALADFAKRKGAVLVFDEILTGLGRTGLGSDGSSWCSGEAAKLADVICIGKALGGGLPVSACLGRGEVMAAWGTSSGEAIHTATFAGNPLGARAALAALEVIESEQLAARASRLGATLIADLRQTVARHGAVRDVRGRGLLLAVEFAQPLEGLRICRALLERGYLTLPCGEDARGIQLLPPAVVEGPVLAAFLGALDAVLTEQGLP